MVRRSSPATLTGDLAFLEFPGRSETTRLATGTDRPGGRGAGGATCRHGGRLCRRGRRISGCVRNGSLGGRRSRLFTSRSRSSSATRSPLVAARLVGTEDDDAVARRRASSSRRSPTSCRALAGPRREERGRRSAAPRGAPERRRGGRGGDRFERGRQLAGGSPIVGPRAPNRPRDRSLSSAESAGSSNRGASRSVHPVAASGDGGAASPV
jgi:hypothetical protein